MSHELIQRAAEHSLSLVERAGRVEITSTEDADEVGRLLMQVKAAQKDIQDARKRITKPMRDAIDEAIEQEKAALTPLKDAEQHLKGIVLDWHQQEALRLEEERAALEQRQADLEGASLRAMEEGRYEDATEALAERDAFQPEEKPYRAAGTQVREVWKAEVYSMYDFVQWCVREGNVHEYLSPNMTRINGLARVRREQGGIPGLRFYSEKSVAATGRA